MYGQHAELAHAIEAQREALVRSVLVRSAHTPWERAPSSLDGQRQQVDGLIRYLAQALAVSCPALFSDYVRWARLHWAGPAAEPHDLATLLTNVQEELFGALPEHAWPLVEDLVLAGRDQLAGMPEGAQAFVEQRHPFSTLARAYLSALLAHDRRRARELILSAVAEGMEVADVYLHVFQPVQHEVGRLWQTNELSVAEEHYVTAVTQLVMSELYPYIFQSARAGSHTMLAACVGGDLHEIGLRMVVDLLELDGWDTQYLGSDVPTAELLDALLAQEIDVLGLSVTMTYHLDAAIDLIEQVRVHPALSSVRILVGGYPFNVDDTLWQRIGADGYAADAQQAVDAANALLQTKTPAERA